MRLATLVLALVAPLSAALADAVTIDGIEWRYRVEADGTVTLGGGTYAPSATAIDQKTAGAVVIPGEIEGRRVLRLHKYAFWKCDQITSVTIPGTIDRFLLETFEDCTNLTSVTIGDGVRDLGYQAFQRCWKLESIEIPDSVTNVGYQAFQNCIGLRRARLSANLDHTGGEAFMFCSSLEDLEIPEGVKSIGGASFSGCTSLAQVNLPESLVLIRDSAFRDCSALESIEIPDAVTAIQSGAFAGCSRLKRVKLGNGLKEIAADAFSGCGALEAFEVGADNAHFKSVNGLLMTKDGSRVIIGVGGDAVIPQGATEIGPNAFAGRGALTSVAIPDTVTVVGSGAFSGCGALAGVTLPAALESIGDNAFNGCGALKSVVIPGAVTKIGSDAFAWCGSLASLEIGGSVETIGSYAFSHCTNLTSVVVPDSVTLLDSCAFSNCLLLKAASLPFSLKAYENAYDYFDTCTSGVAVAYRPVEVGDSIFFANTHGDFGSLTMPWSGTVVNESNFDFMVPASDELPAGVKLRIKRITFNSLTKDFTAWSTSDNKSDPYRVRLNGVNSSQYTQGGSIVCREVDAQRLSPNAPLTYEFSDSSPCEIVVGRKYGAAQGNSAGGVGDGLAFLHSNGNLLYSTVNGVGADRASVTYVDSHGGIVSTPTADSVTGTSGIYFPLYRIEAEVVALEPSALDSKALDYSTLGAVNTIAAIPGGWFGGATSFGGEAPANARLGPTLAGGRVLQTGNQAFPWRSVAARTSPFSLALYADVSAMPADGRAVMVALGNSWSGGIAIMFREGGKVKFGIGGTGGITGSAASVDVLPGFHLYTAVCDPATGRSTLSLDGGAVSVGEAGSGVTLGEGFQIGSFFRGMSGGSAFTTGPGLAIARLLGYDAALTARDVGTLAAQFPAVPLPEAGGDDDVALALGGVDPSLANRIATKADYEALCEWAQRLEDAGAATKSTACTAPTAFLSFALDAPCLVGEPQQGDLKVEALDGASGGALEAVVSLDGVTIGSRAAEARLKQIFDVVGGAELDEDGFSADAVSLSLSPTADGKVKVSVVPKAQSGRFFMRVRVKK